MNKTLTVTRLEELAALLRRYAHIYFEALEKNAPLSARHYGWIDTYDNAKHDHPQVWAAYCAKTGAYPAHRSGDVVC